MPTTKSMFLFIQIRHLRADVVTVSSQRNHGLSSPLTEPLTAIYGVKKPLRTNCI